MTVLAGDIGGTNSRLAIYDVPASGAARRQADLRADVPVAGLRVAGRHRRDVPRRGPGRDRRRRQGRRSACFGIAGPIENNMCRATNLPWVVDGRALAQRLGIARVMLVNDFYAAALGVTAVGADELVALGGGVAGRRTGRSPYWARGRGSARPSCSGRPPKPLPGRPVGGRPRRPGARARRSSTAWCSS